MSMYTSFSGLPTVPGGDNKATGNGDNSEGGGIDEDLAARFAALKKG